MLCGEEGDRRVEHGSEERIRLGAAYDPDSESAAPRAETALCVRGYPADGLCLEGARREARTLTWLGGEGSAEARVSTLRLPGRCRRSRAEDRRPAPQSHRHKSGPSAPPREAPEEGPLQAREAARRSVARRRGGVGLDHPWPPARRVIEPPIRSGRPHRPTVGLDEGASEGRQPLQGCQRRVAASETEGDEEHPPAHGTP